MAAQPSFTVALVGPDGVGKTTIARRLEADAELPIKYLYMGDNPQASNVTLPTTRWWKARKARLRAAASAAAPRAVAAAAPTNGTPSAAGAHRDAGTGTSGRRRGLARTLVRPVRKALGLVNRVAEETYRQSVASSFERRGFIVLFDRHFLLDYWHTDVASAAPQRSLKRRVHGFLLQRVLREPDLVICLDAPGDVVWRRKGELTPEILERRRRQYRELGARVRHFAVIDATRPLEQVLDDVLDRIQRFRTEPRHAVL